MFSDTLFPVLGGINIIIMFTHYLYSRLLAIFGTLVFLFSAGISFLVPSVQGSRDGRDGYVLSPSDNVFRLEIATNDVVYNPFDQMLYASRPSSAGADGNSISRINPLTGQIVGSVYVGSEPNKLALSHDGRTLYVALDGSFEIRRYDVTTQIPGIRFPVGRENSSPGFLGTPYVGGDLAVAPGDPDLLAVARYRSDGGGSGAAVALFRNGVQLTQTGSGQFVGSDFLAFSSSASTLYGSSFDGSLRVITLNESGITNVSTTNFQNGLRKIKFENNLIFTASAQIIDPATRLLFGTIPNTFSDAFVPVTASGRVLYAQRDTSNFNHVAIRAFDINTRGQIGVLTVPDVRAEARTLVRYGTNGLAMRTDNNQLYFIQTSLIPTENPLPPPVNPPVPTPTPTPRIFSKFVRQISLPANDILFSPTEQKIYASVSPTPGAVSNTVSRLNPATGAIESSIPVGSNPGRLALSDDGRTLYVGINGEGAVRRFDTASQTAGPQFSIGSNPNFQITAFDIDVMPGNSNTVAVGKTSDGTEIYDNGIRRSRRVFQTGPIEFASPALLYIHTGPLLSYAVAPDGLTEAGGLSTLASGEFELVDGLLYTSSGTVLDTNGSFKGRFFGVGFSNAFTVDRQNNRIFFLNNGSCCSSGQQIQAYRLDNFLPAGTVPLPEIPQLSNPRRLLRWGTNGLAFFDPDRDRVYLLQTNLIGENTAVPTGLEIGLAAYPVNEGSGSVAVTVVRTGDLSATTTVNYSTRDSTALGGIDYTVSNGTLTFLAGEVNKTIIIPITNDNIFETAESFDLTLTSPAGPGTIEILRAQSTITITDNDTLPIGSAANIIVNEPRPGETASAQFIISLTNPTSQTAVVNYATVDGTAMAGSDYVAVSGTLTFAPLETTKTIVVQILPDANTSETSETFKLSLSNSLNLSINNTFGTATILNFNPQASRRTHFDYDGDGRADISVFRPSIGDWYVQGSSSGLSAVRFGRSTDRITPADYDGDGKTDIAVYRPSDRTWFIVKSSDGTFSLHIFGLSGDIPLPGDFDGDGVADISVFRPSDGTFYRQNSRDGSFFARQFGQNGDKPVLGDFDGDGKADLALFRPSSGVWYYIRSSDGAFFGEQFGVTTDTVVPADYDGDGKTDLAVYRPSNGFWYIKRSLTADLAASQFGLTTDIPAPGDFDGDGKADLSVFRPSDGLWYRTNSGNSSFFAFQFGTNGDRPTPSAFQ